LTLPSIGSLTIINQTNDQVGAENVDNGNDSDVESLFGDIGELNKMLDGASEDNNNREEFPGKKSAHNHVTASTKSGNVPQTPVKKTKATTPGQLTLPSAPYLTLPTTATERNNAHPVQAAPTVTNEETSESTTPQCPPVTPPRLTNIPMSGPPASRNIYGPENHNDMPSKPDTPLADQLRSDFWHRNRQEKQALFGYKKSYKDWTTFTTTESNKTKPDYNPTAEQLKTLAIAAQAAWTNTHQSFEAWKAANPAVSLIIANIHEDVRSIQADEQGKEEREEFIRDMSDKPANHRQSELAKYDKFAYLMSESRERDQWRKRVVTQTRVQAMLEAQQQAALEEQNRLAAKAEAERKRAAAEAEDLRKKAAAAAARDERRKREVEAEEQRKQAEAKAAEEARLAAVVAQSHEEERRWAEAASAAEKLADDGLFQGQGNPLAGMSITAKPQEQGQQNASGQAVTAPVASPNTAVAGDFTTADLNGLQTGSNNVQDSQL
jgi:hypothetical protein